MVQQIEVSDAPARTPRCPICGNNDVARDQRGNTVSVSCRCGAVCRVHYEPACSPGVAAIIERIDNIYEPWQHDLFAHPQTAATLRTQIERAKSAIAGARSSVALSRSLRDRLRTARERKTPTG